MQFKHGFSSLFISPFSLPHSLPPFSLPLPLSLPLSLPPSLLSPTGLLGAVNDITVELTDSTLVTVHWSPPYSLVNVPIVNYTLLIAGLLSDYSMIHVSTQPSHVFSLPDLCDQYVLTVIPSNDAGDGINSTIDVYKLPGEFV